jgi:hydroxyacylglutathione hydrolase
LPLFVKIFRMYIQQIYTNCLAQAAYYIESGNEAVVIDPLRNPEPYIQLAQERKATIKYVLETHFHADFVSGHIDLANKTGATIVFGSGATPGYQAYVAADGDMLHVGSIRIEVLHTPGHTIESACYLVYDEEGKRNCVFTGDTLFVGDVGRPDLLSGDLPKEELAAMLFNSIRTKISPLPDDVVVYPGHGAGSACGKNLGKETYSTIGQQRATNYAMQLTDKEAFIKAVTSGQPAIPGYFFSDAKLNRSGYDSFDEVMKKGTHVFTAEEVVAMQKNGAMVIDTRDPMSFAAGFIPGAINIGLNGDFAVWTGTLVKPSAAIVLVTDSGKEYEAIERLARIGYDNVPGHLGGGMDTWFRENREIDRVMTFSGSDISDLVASGKYDLLDVRNRREAAKDRIAGATHIPLNELQDRYTMLKKDANWLIYCAGGYRSMIAASFLKSNGYHFVASVEGGMTAVRKLAPQLVDDVELMDVE